MSKHAFENDIERLEEIVKLLETGNVALEDSVSLYEEGLKLAKKCTEELNNAKQKVIEIDEYLKEQTADE